MLMGLRFQAFPTPQQKHTLSQWMGCVRMIWNAKCQEYQYHLALARKLFHTGLFPPIDQTYSHFKNKELTPWLADCPSQLLRNSAANWYNTFQHHLKGLCGKPKPKKKHDNLSLHLTSELFFFDVCPDSRQLKLFIGTKTNHIGVLAFNQHIPHFCLPKSIRIKKKNARYWLSFCYEDHLDDSKSLTQEQHLERLRTKTAEELESLVEAVDCGIHIPAQTTRQGYDFTAEQKRSMKREEKKKKRLQRALTRGKKGSRRREKKKWRIARSCEKSANIRKDFHHKTSKALVESAEVLVFEDLRIKQMTKRPKAKYNEETGKTERKGVKAKAGLNRAILNVGWHQLQTFTEYKAYRAGKVTYKVSACYSSQECADCGHTHPENRASQASFVCQKCGHKDNADRNAAKVLKKRAIERILDSGTELSVRGVLLPDKGRGATRQTPAANADGAGRREASKNRAAHPARSSAL